MKCRGCGQDLDGDNYKMVADWPFCTACFEGLLHKPAQERMEEVGREPVQPEPKPDPSLCSMCRKELLPGEGRQLAVWILCPQCYADLVSPTVPEEPKDEDAATVTSTAPEEDESSASGGNVPEDGDEAASRIQVTVTKFIQCAKCGRKIPQGGSRLRDGSPLCPDCYYSRDETAEEGHSGMDDEPSVPPGGKGIHPEPVEDVQDVVKRCAACGAAMEAGLLERVDGFLICRACFTTDPGLAVQIAREKHRRSLQQLSISLRQPTD